VTRGLVPACVPSTARKIREAHDIDTNEQWLAFQSSEPIAGWEKVDNSLLSGLRIRVPRGVSWWPSELVDQVVRGQSSVSVFRVTSEGRATCYVLVRDR
jgi:hypothetical protein